MNYVKEWIKFYGIRDDQSKKRILFYSFDAFKNLHHRLYFKYRTRE